MPSPVAYSNADSPYTLLHISHCTFHTAHFTMHTAYRMPPHAPHTHTQDALETTIRDSAAARPVSLEVAVRAAPMQLLTEDMGHDAYPKLFVRPNLIHAVGTGRWGVMLSSTSGVEWQLFIASKTDILLSNMGKPVDLTTPAGEVVCARGSFMESGAAAYRHLLGRQCPTHIGVGVGAGGIQLNSPPPEVHK